MRYINNLRCKLKKITYKHMHVQCIIIFVLSGVFQCGNGLSVLIENVKDNVRVNVDIPVPGGSGTITTSGVLATSLTLNWTKADDNGPQALLQYKIVQSLVNNINTITDAETNGTLVQDWTADIDTCEAIGLSTSTPYYFNVLVKDPLNNMAIYDAVSDTTDVAIDLPPVPGGSGTMTTSGILATSLTLNWTKAADDGSQELLQYKIFRSDFNNIETVVNAETNGTMVQDWTTDINTYNVTGLSSSSTYYFNVLVKDPSNNNVAYTMMSATTADGVASTPGGGNPTIATSNIQKTSITLTWIKATDIVTPQANLQYCVYQATTGNIDTVANVIANGTMIKDWTTDIDTWSATGLTHTTLYYFNVLVKDGAGNTSAYSMKSQQTADGTLPTPGNGGLLTFSNLAQTSLTLNWTKATDNQTAQNLLQYRAYCSVSNIDTVDNVLANGTAIGAWTTDINTINITGLTSDITYYFNVLVQDADANITVYTSNSQKTLANLNSYVLYYPLSSLHPLSDLSSNALNLTNFMTDGGPLYADRFSTSNNAWRFCHSCNDYMYLTDPPLLSFTTEMTISLWIYAVDPSQDERIIGKAFQIDVSNHRGYLVGVNSNKIKIEIWDTASTSVPYTIEAGTISAATWTHIGVTWKTGGKMRLYVNGVIPSGGEIDAGSNPISNGSPARFIIGTASWTSTFFAFDGRIDDVRMYAKEMNIDEMQLLMNAMGD